MAGNIRQKSTKRNTKAPPKKLLITTLFFYDMVRSAHKIINTKGRIFAISKVLHILQAENSITCTFKGISWLSTSTFWWRIVMFAVCQLLLGDLRRYNGYPTLAVIMSEGNCFYYRFGSCILFLTTMWNNSAIPFLPINGVHMTTYSKYT